MCVPKLPAVDRYRVEHDVVQADGPHLGRDPVGGLLLGRCSGNAKAERM